MSSSPPTSSSYSTDGTPHIRPSTSSQNLNAIQRSSTPLGFSRASPKAGGSTQQPYEYPEVAGEGKKQQQSSIALGVVFVIAIVFMIVLFRNFPEVAESVRSRKARGDRSEDGLSTE
jgi:hypothetical protein